MPITPIAGAASFEAIDQLAEGPAPSAPEATAKATPLPPKVSREQVVAAAREPISAEQADLILEGTRGRAEAGFDVSRLFSELGDPAVAANTVFAVLKDRHPDIVALHLRVAATLSDTFEALADTAPVQALFDEARTIPKATIKSVDARAVDVELVARNVPEADEQELAERGVMVTRHAAELRADDGQGPARGLRTLASEDIQALQTLLSRAAPTGTNDPFLAKLRRETEVRDGDIMPVVLRELERLGDKRRNSATQRTMRLVSAVKPATEAPRVGQVDKTALDREVEALAQATAGVETPSPEAFEEALREDLRIPIDAAHATLVRAVARKLFGNAVLSAPALYGANLSRGAIAHLVAAVVEQRHPAVFADVAGDSAAERFSYLIDDGRMDDVLTSLHREMYAATSENFQLGALSRPEVQENAISFKVEGDTERVQFRRHRAANIDIWTYAYKNARGNLSSLSVTNLQRILSFTYRTSVLGTHDPLLKHLREERAAAEGALYERLAEHTLALLRTRKAPTRGDRELVGQTATLPKRPVDVGASLLDSPVPRWYQRETHDELQGNKYNCDVVVSATGSGKSHMTMMCLEDWLQKKKPDEVLLISVPTPELQEQMMREICVNDMGIRMELRDVFVGQPSEIQARIRQCRQAKISPPKVVIVSHDGLNSMRRQGFAAFFAETKIRYVALDEMHYLVETPKSPSWQATKELAALRKAGGIEGLVGLSATLSGKEEMLKGLGYRVSINIPEEILMASGAITPFVQFDVAFGYSSKEKKVFELIEEHKKDVHILLDTLGRGPLLAWLDGALKEHGEAALLEIYRTRFGRYTKGKGGAAKLKAHLNILRKGDKAELGSSVIDIVLALQLLDKVMDGDLVAHLGERRYLSAERRAEVESTLQEALERIEGRRGQLATALENTPIYELVRADPTDPIDTHGQTVDEDFALISRTMGLGLSLGLQKWGRTTGEGRSEAIREVVKAQREARKQIGAVRDDRELVSLVFDTSQRLEPPESADTVVEVGAGGIPGTFAALMDDKNFSPVASLVGEVYLPEDTPELRSRIIEHVVDNIVGGEVTDAFTGQALFGLEVMPADKRALEDLLQEVILDYVRTTSDEPEPGRHLDWDAFIERMQAGLRESGVYWALGTRERAALSEQIAGMKRTSLRTPALAVFNWLQVVERLKHPSMVQVKTISGKQHQVAVVRFPVSGPVKRLRSQLIGSLIDSPELGINTAVVGDRDRTGWNTRRPQVIVDACRPRSNILKTQTIGRAQRPAPEWNLEMEEVVYAILGRPALRKGGGQKPREQLNKRQLGLLEEALALTPFDNEFPEVFEKGDLSSLEKEDRLRLVRCIMLAYNKGAIAYVQLLQKRGRATDDVVAAQGVLQRKADLTAALIERHGINPETGEFTNGVEQAPILNAKTDDSGNIEPFVSSDAHAQRMAAQVQTVFSAYLRSAHKIPAPKP